MKISKYKMLIDNLPYLDQAFKPNKTIWTKLLDTKYQNDNPFYIDWDIGYSRNDLFTMELSELKLICILMWGYPTGGRGKNIKTVLEQLDIIKILLREYENQEIYEAQLYKLISGLNAITGLGRSTWTKFLYFSGIRYMGNRLLILDDKINKALSNKCCDGVKFGNMALHKDIRYYIEYIKGMNELSRKLDVEADKIELFFFMFSDILRLKSE